MKPLLILLCLVCVLAKPADAQPCANSSNYLGTKSLYHPLQQKYTPAPAGYQAVFINYVGRHGARHLTKPLDASSAWQMLMAANSANQLTAQGKQLWQMVMKLQKVEAPNLKSISIIGAEEQNGIGVRMIAENKNVFAKPGKIKVSTTKEVRTEQSANAFLTGAKLSTQSGDSVVFEKNNTDELRFYDVSPAYLDYDDNGGWQAQMLLLSSQNQIQQLNAGLIKRFFIADFIKTWKPEKAQKFVDDVIGFAEIVPSARKEIIAAGYTLQELDFFSFVSCGDLQKLNLMDTAADFLEKGPGMNGLGIQVKIAAPLLVDFIKTTDNYIQNQDTIVDLRFAHAETIGPFAALLDLKGASTAVKSISDFQKVYQADEIIDLSANIRWILYRKNSIGDYLVKVLLNENEAAVNGLKTSNFPYYKWQDLRAFYLAKLKKVGTGLNADMHHYLMTVK